MIRATITILFSTSLMLLSSMMRLAAAEERPPRIAIADFTTEENSFRAELAAVDFSTALQALLANEPGVEWVERAQLAAVEKEHALPALGFADPDRSLKLGKWAKADLMLTGWFHDKTATNQYLRIEVIDLGRAAVLMSTNPPAHFGTATDPGSVVSGVNAIGDWLRQQLQQAIVKWRFQNSQPNAAPLFFDYLGHSSSSSSLPIAESKHQLTEAFRRRIGEELGNQKGIQVFNLSRPSRASEESALIATGLAEAGNGSPSIAAPLYVWGGFTTHQAVTEGPAAGQREVKSFMRLKFNFWNGASNTTQTTKEISADGDSEEVVKRFGSALRDNLPNAWTKIPDETMRLTLSDRVYERAKWLDGFLFRPWQGEAGQFQAVDEIMRMYEMSFYLNPKNQRAHEDWVYFRWDFDFMLASKNRFRFMWHASESWGEHVDRFGLDTIRDHSASFNQPEGERFGSRHVAANYLLWPNRLLELLHSGSRDDFGVPRDAGRETITRWQNHWGAVLLQRVRQAGGREEIIPFAPYIVATCVPESGDSPIIPESKTVTALVEALWPAYIKNLQRAGATNIPAKLSTSLSLLYKQAGQEERLEQLLTQTAWAKTGRVQQAPLALARTEAIVSRSFGAIGGLNFGLSQVPSPVDGLASRKVVFPEGVELVDVKRAEVSGRHLYALAETLILDQGNSNKPEQTAGLRSIGMRATNLWKIDSTSMRATIVRLPDATNIVRDFCKHGDALWLVMDRLPLTRLNEKTGEWGTEGKADGLNVAEIHRIAASQTSTVVTADGESWYWRSDESGAWRSMRENSIGPPGRFSASAILFTLAGEWLVAHSGPTFLGRLGADRWTPFHEQLVIDCPSLLPLEINCLEPDSQGRCWLGSSLGLHLVEPASGKVENWFSASGFDGVHEFGQRVRHRGRVSPERIPAESLPSDLAIAREHRKQNPPKSGSVLNPLEPKTRIPGPVYGIISDGGILWVSCGTSEGLRLLQLHPESGRLLGAYAIPGMSKMLRATEDKIWYSGPYGSVGRPLFALPKSALPSAAKDSDSKTSIRLSASDQALWRSTLPRFEQAVYVFLSGDYLGTLEQLSVADPFLANELELALAGLCYNREGLNQPAKARELFAELAQRVKIGPLAEFARDQMKQLEAVRSTTP